MSYLHDCAGLASKRRRVAFDSDARRPPISPLFVQVDDDQGENSEEDAEVDTHLSLPTSAWTLNPCITLILSNVSYSSSDDHGNPSPVASFSSLEETDELISTNFDLTIVKGIAT